jgi:hypothetical protein
MDVSEEVDKWGFPVDPAERMQHTMLGFHDLIEEARDADFPNELLRDLEMLRLKFLDEFELRFPGYGKGRAAWR